MTNFSLDVRTDAEGSLVVRASGRLDVDCAVQFRQLLVHSVRRVRPLRLILELDGVTALDPINLGTLAALCDLADDHHVVVFLADPPAAVRVELLAAGVPKQRLRYAPTAHAEHHAADYARATAIVETPAAASIS